MTLTVASRTAPPPADWRGDRHPVLSDRLAVLLLMFCALIPLKWDRLGIDLPVPVQPDHLGWVLATTAVLLALIERRGRLVAARVPLLVLPLIGWMALSAVWSVEALATVRDLVFQLGWLAFGILIAIGRRLIDLLTVVVRAGAVLLVAGWLVALLLPSIGRHQGDPHAGTLRGLFVDKNTLGYVAMLVLLSALALAWDRRAPRRLQTWLVAGLAALTVVVSNSRTALVVAAVGVVLLLGIFLLSQLRRPRTLALTIWGAAALGAGYIGQSYVDVVSESLGRDATLTGRTNIWTIVLQAVEQRPLLGYGWKALWIDGSPVTEELWARNHGTAFYHAHNGYLDVAAQLGIVGLLLMLLFLGGVLVQGARRFQEVPTPDQAWPVVLVLAVLVYNVTEVAGLTGVTFVILAAIATVFVSGPVSDPTPKDT